MYKHVLVDYRAHVFRGGECAFCVNALPTTSPPTYYLPNRLIALEEHAVSPSLEAELLASGFNSHNPPGLLEKLKDVGTGRIADMDAGNLSLQVLAQLSALGSDDPEGCRKANDAIKSAIDANPSRFAGFAVLPMATPNEAAVELERSVTKLGFKGAMIWNHLKDGTYYDAARFDPVFATAQKLNVPIYLHPASPTQEIFAKLFAGNYDARAAGQISTGSFGWHIDVGTHVLRLYAAGHFVRFPKLKLIIGHNGEGLPMFIDRIDSTGLRNDTKFDKVWKTNIWTTTSGFFTVRQFQQLRQVSPIERIMYSIDYPLSSATEGWAFIMKLAESKILTKKEMDKFAYRNAEELLKL
ncbi:hypothetical protein T440DRAFT_492053 [Plenodomus tracheiphilus IPT5]|uniref:Amidohydrolase-related domain-containing protein n=1 Tax=Plenodomus tracheiphilus IPT5 TaxID=1408161 RepID=A0A6A7AVC8_9PLEO|nr:hypothetical protein T440DRAFT_492053 [Plenodomus tracheiphilus IPT5]